MSELFASLMIPLLAAAALPAAMRLLGNSEDREGPIVLALSHAIGLVWCMSGGMLLGSAGLLTTTYVMSWLLAGIGLNVVLAFRDRGSPNALGALPRSFRGFGGLAVGAGAGTGLLLLATVPPWYRDSLTYHIALPRYFAMNGATHFPDDNIFASFPLGWESALSFLYVLGPDAGTSPVFNPRLVGAWTMIAVALAVVSLARRAGAGRGLATCGGFLWLALPTVIEFGSSAYVESALVLFVTLSLWFATREGTSHSTSAVWAGLAAWVKYPALALAPFLLLALPVMNLLRLPPGEAREKVLSSEASRAFRWGVLFAVVACPFFLRNLIVRGNPIFPTAFALFGGEGWDAMRAFAYSVTLDHYGRGRDLADYLLLPWRLATERSMNDGFEGSLGPLPFIGLLAALVLLALWRKRIEHGRVWGFLITWVAWMFCFWAATVQQTRFFLMAVPAMFAVGLAATQWMADQSAVPRRRGIVVSAAIGLIAIQSAWSVDLARTLWQKQVTSEWLRGEVSRDAVLERMLPESFRPLQDLSRDVAEGERVWLVWMRGYTYYLDRPYRLDSIFEAWRLEAMLEAEAAPRAFGAALREDGIDYLLVNHRFFLDRESADLEPGRTQRLRDRFSSALRAGEIKPVRQWGPVILYAVDDGEMTDVASIAQPDRD